MQPGFDLRIQTMIKALSETVLPAVDEGNRSAVEQLHLVVGSLRMLNEQIDYAHWFEVTEARDMAGLLSDLASVGRPVDVAVDQAPGEQAVALAARHDIPLSRLRQVNLELREAISRALERIFATGDEAAARRARGLVLEQGKRQIGRERAFVAAAGFDAFPDDLLSIEESLAKV